MLLTSSILGAIFVLFSFIDAQGILPTVKWPFKLKGGPLGPDEKQDKAVALRFHGGILSAAALGGLSAVGGGALGGNAATNIAAPLTLGRTGAATGPLTGPLTNPITGPVLEGAAQGGFNFGQQGPGAASPLLAGPGGAGGTARLGTPAADNFGQQGPGVVASPNGIAATAPGGQIVGEGGNQTPVATQQGPWGETPTLMEG